MALASLEGWEVSEKHSPELLCFSSQTTGWKMVLEFLLSWFAEKRCDTRPYSSAEIKEPYLVLEPYPVPFAINWVYLESLGKLSECSNARYWDHRSWKCDTCYTSLISVLQGRRLLALLRDVLYQSHSGLKDWCGYWTRDIYTKYRRHVRAGNMRVNEAALGRWDWKAKLSSQTIAIQRQSRHYFESLVKWMVCGISYIRFPCHEMQLLLLLFSRQTSYRAVILSTQLIHTCRNSHLQTQSSVQFADNLGNFWAGWRGWCQAPGQWEILQVAVSRVPSWLLPCAPSPTGQAVEGHWAGMPPPWCVPTASLGHLASDLNSMGRERL